MFCFNADYYFQKKRRPLREIGFINYSKRFKSLQKTQAHHISLALVNRTKIKPDKNLNDIITYVNGRSFREKRYCTTTCRLVKSLGWNEQITFDQGLDKTIQWFKLNQNYWNK